jgi:nucleoid-associated protein YgaU
MIQLRLPMPLPEPRQPLTTRQLWQRLNASNAGNEFQPVATSAASTATERVNRKPTGNASVMLIRTVTVLIFAVLLMVGCSDAESVTVADYWGLNDTPQPTATAAATPTATPTIVPTLEPTSMPTVTPAAAPVIVDDVASQVQADGQQYQIVKGDNLWRIARAALRNSGATWNNSAVGRYVADIVDVNPDTQQNPDLIYPNQIVMLPVVTP